MIWYTGQTAPIWDIPLALDNNLQEDLTGVSAGNFTLIFRNTNRTPPIDIVGTGTLTIKSINPGELLYKPSAADVANPFSGEIVITANFPPSNTTADQVVYDPVPFVIAAV